MRIVNIIQRYPPAIGGSETWCQEVCRYLAKRGHKVKVLTLDVHKEEEYWRDPRDEERTLSLGRFTLDEGVVVRRYRRSLPIHSVHHLIYKKLLDRVLNLYFYGPHSGEMYGKLSREIKSADVVFLHTLPYPHNYVAFALAKLFRKKTVIVPHFHPTHPDYERRSNYWLLRNCDAVLTVTEFEKQYLKEKGVPTDKLFVTGNAIDPKEYEPTDLEAFRSMMVTEYGLRPDDRVITFVGRKTEEKGAGHLIEAVRGLLDEMPVKLFLVGPRFAEYERLYGALSKEERCRIIDLGVLSHQDKVNLLHLSNLLALPSRYEAFGIVFLEAWICGVPVLGTDRGAMPSVIGDEGVLSRFADVGDLRQKLRTALSDLNKLQIMGESGKERVIKKYTWEVIGAKTEEALKTALSSEKDAMKIVVVTNAYPPRFIGGAELVAHAQARLLKESGHKVIVFAGEPNDKGERYALRKDVLDGIPVYRVCLHQQDYSTEFLNFYNRQIHVLFECLLEDFSPDIVHFHNLTGLSASLIQAAKQKNARTVMTLHDYAGICVKNTLIKSDDRLCDDFSRCAECIPSVSDEHWKEVPVRMRRDYLALQFQAVDTFISPSSYLAGKYIQSGIREEKIKIVWNGLDLSRFTEKPKSDDPKRVRFSYVGYLGRHKGVHIILDALSLLSDVEAKVTVNFVGSGEGKGRLESRVRDMGLQGSVRFLGQVSNEEIADVYQQTDVLILPSIWPENQPVSITEAMASRTPVIASRIGGIPELVEDGKTGYLFEAGNASELAQRMSEFIADRSKLGEFGANAFRKISGDGFTNPTEKIIELYRERMRLPATNVLAEEMLIVCLGKEMNSECARAMDIFLKESRHPWRFVMCDWLPRDQVKRAHLLWVVDDEISVDEAVIGLQNKLPLLVPGSNPELRDLCLQGQCGLYYRDALEAVECLHHLTAHLTLSMAMGQNSFRRFYARRSMGHASIAAKSPTAQPA